MKSISFEMFSASHPFVGVQTKDNNMEMKWENTTFVRVDADIVDNLIDKQEGAESVLSKEETENLKKMFEFPISDLHVTIEVKGLSKEAAPVVACGSRRCGSDPRGGRLERPLRCLRSR